MPRSTGGARLLTLRSFLTANAIKFDQLHDRGSTGAAATARPRARSGRSGVPLLLAAMGGNTGIRDNEMLYDMAASRDKDFIVVEGATHNIERCTECETRGEGQGDQRHQELFQLRGEMDHLQVLGIAKSPRIAKSARNSLRSAEASWLAILAKVTSPAQSEIREVPVARVAHPQPDFALCRAIPSLRTSSVGCFYRCQRRSESSVP